MIPPLTGCPQRLGIIVWGHMHSAGSLVIITTGPRFRELEFVVSEFFVLISGVMRV